MLVAKYCDHLPLYRQAVIYAREGVELSRVLLAPLVEAIRAHIMAASKVHADDTPVLAPDNSKTKTGRLWVYVRADWALDAPAVWFAYTQNRKGKHPQAHLAGYSDVLQADAYGGYQAIYARGRVHEVVCRAHARRKFHDLHVAWPSVVTAEALRRIGELYAIKTAIRGKPPDWRQQIRQQRTRPLLDSLEVWLQERLQLLSRKSDTTAAINYVLSQWQALRCYCDDGIIEIDNNAAERSLRAVALGRKNYLCDSQTSFQFS